MQHEGRRKAAKVDKNMSEHGTVQDSSQPVGRSDVPPEKIEGQKVIVLKLEGGSERGGGPFLGS